jgi:hypothetical protein
MERFTLSLHDTAISVRLRRQLQHALPPASSSELANIQAAAIAFVRCLVSCDDACVIDGLQDDQIAGTSYRDNAQRDHPTRLLDAPTAVHVTMHPVAKSERRQLVVPIFSG